MTDSHQKKLKSFKANANGLSLFCLMMSPLWVSVIILLIATLPSYANTTSYTSDSAYPIPESFMQIPKAAITKRKKVKINGSR